MSTPTVEQLERRQKLIDFLRELPREKFDFSIVYDIRIKGCGCAGCAMGWTPVLFPDLVEYTDAGWGTFSVRIKDRDNYSASFGYANVAAFLFGMDGEEAECLFAPDTLTQPAYVKGHLCDIWAKPKEVAARLEAFWSRSDRDDGEIKTIPT